MKKTITIYIAGKITGEPIYACIRKFTEASVGLWRVVNISNVDKIINPLRLPGIYFGIPHDEAMKICLAALKTCTHAYFLSDWEDSDGAREEHQFCLENNIQIIYQ